MKKIHACRVDQEKIPALAFHTFCTNLRKAGRKAYIIGRGLSLLLSGFPNRWTLWNSILPRGFSIQSLFSRNLNTKSLVSSGGESTAEAGTTSSIPKNLTFSLLD